MGANCLGRGRLSGANVSDGLLAWKAISGCPPRYSITRSRIIVAPAQDCFRMPSRGKYTALQAASWSETLNKLAAEINRVVVSAACCVVFVELCRIRRQHFHLISNAVSRLALWAPLAIYLSVKHRCTWGPLATFLPHFYYIYNHQRSAPTLSDSSWCWGPGVK